MVPRTPRGDTDGLKANLDLGVTERNPFSGFLRAMDQIVADMFPPTQIAYPVIFARFIGAIVFGAVIGLERERKDRPAGLKTHIMVSLAAALFAIISIESVHMPGLDREAVRIDPLRVVEAVTAGVAFLAAGTIVLSKGEVKGLTTGASLWLSGAIGLALGFGHWMIGLFVTCAAFFVLYVLGRLEHGHRQSEAEGGDGRP
jgi:putative Mg2+ transporter-C (MgtC) family protein